MTNAVMIFITAGSEEEAARIATSLVDEHLVACVNAVPGVRSFFFWDGKTRDEREVLLICKGRQERLAEVISRVKALHTYTIPEIIALPIVGGSENYLAWVSESVRV